MIHVSEIHEYITAGLLLNCVQAARHYGHYSGVSPKKSVSLKSLFSLVNSSKEEHTPLPYTAPAEKNCRATSTHKISTESAVRGEFVPQLFIEK